jgi:hypothetical protein
MTSFPPIIPSPVLPLRRPLPLPPPPLATTIIDFSPQALEIDQVAEAAGTINPDIPPPTLPTINSADTNPNSNRAFADVFMGNAPDILFVAEYADANADPVGVLIVWENYYNASHYEVWKRVYTAQDNSWQRIFIIDSTHLKTETDQYRPYIEKRLKFRIASDYFAILDTDVKTDTIVQYKVAAGNYPASAAVDYEAVLKSQGALSLVDINTTDTIFDFSQRVFGTRDYGWIISLLNFGAQFFGKAPVTVPLRQFIIGSQAYVPKNLALIPKIVQESIYYFGLYATLKNMLSYTSDTTDLVGYTNFIPLILESINTSNNTLSYNTLQAKLKIAYPNYADYMNRLSQGTIQNQPIIIPNYTDASSFTSLTDLTFMFLRLNTILVTVLYALDKDPAIRAAADVAARAAADAAAAAQAGNAAPASYDEKSLGPEYTPRNYFDEIGIYRKIP